MNHSQNAVSSMEAIGRSIETDFQVFRWFTFLISHGEVQALLIHDEKVRVKSAEKGN